MYHLRLSCRYSDPLLPRLVPVEEMDQLLPLVEKSKATIPSNGTKAQSVAEVIRSWYRKDENACPAVYVLQPISSHFKEFVTTTGKCCIILGHTQLLKCCHPLRDNEGTDFLA